MTDPSVLPENLPTPRKTQVVILLSLLLIIALFVDAFNGSTVMGPLSQNLVSIGNVCLLLGLLAFLVHRSFDHGAPAALRLIEPLVVLAAFSGYWSHQLGVGQAIAAVVFGIATLQFSVLFIEGIREGQSLKIQGRPRIPGLSNKKRLYEWRFSPVHLYFIATLAFALFFSLSLWLTPSMSSQAESAVASLSHQQETP